MKQKLSTLKPRVLQGQEAAIRRPQRFEDYEDLYSKMCAGVSEDDNG
jgi:hypothetical protein